MGNKMKLFTVLALGSALGGCSMAGTGDFFADHYAANSTAQGQQYWGGGHSPCQPAPTNCESAYPVGQQNADTYAYGAPAVTPPVHSYGQATHQYPAAYEQQAYPHAGYAAPGYAPGYVGAQGSSSRGLRQSYTYGTLGATLYDVDSDLFGLQGRAGWQSKGLFGAEVEGSFGVNDDSASVNFGTGFIDAESGVDTQIAGFGVVRYPVSNKLNVLGRVGYHRTALDAEFDDGTTVIETEFSTDGIAYGAGVEYAVTPLTGVRADYTRYDLDGETADAVSLALTRKF